MAVVIASDGVFEFITNKKLMQLIRPEIEKQNCKKATELIVAESVKHWKREDFVIDDITCQVIFLNNLPIEEN